MAPTLWARFAEVSPIIAARGYASAANFFPSRGDDAKALELYELAADQFPAPDRHLADVLMAMAEIHEAQQTTTLGRCMAGTCRVLAP
jgi:hypothetical protein